MACTLYAFSQKRLILSVGAGWFKAEYDAHGIPFPDVKQRKEEFHEALQILRPLTEGKHVAFKGKYYSADVECFPKPDQRFTWSSGDGMRRLFAGLQIMQTS